jgi:DNA repair protein RecO (recombination protein O)
MNVLSAYVLHQYDWSESSLILEMFTREQGRLTFLAKGAKRPYSQLRSVLLPFQNIQVQPTRAPASSKTQAHGSDIQTLRAAHWLGVSSPLRGAALFSGFYLNELLMKLLARQDPHEGLFDDYECTLQALGASHENAFDEAVLRAFEIRLLKHLGVLPDLSVLTVNQTPVQEHAQYNLLPEAGVCSAQASVGKKMIEGWVLIHLQAALQMANLQALQLICAKANAMIKPPLRDFIIWVPTHCEHAR